MVETERDVFELLLALGRQMRQAQIAYFEGRHPSDLARAKRAERAFDRLVAWHDQNTREPGLFGDRPAANLADSAGDGRADPIDRDEALRQLRAIVERDQLGGRP